MRTMKIQTIARALAISAVITLIAPLLVTVISGEGIAYDEPMEPKEFYSLTYEHQQQWLNEHQREMSVAELLEAQLSHPDALVVNFKMYLPFFILMFLGCLLMVYWEGKANET